MRNGNDRRRSVGRSAMLSLALVLTLPGAGGAQHVGGDPAGSATPPGTAGSGILLAGGAGFARGSAKVAGRTGTRHGPALALMMSRSRRGYRTFSVEVEVEPFEVPNTERDERFSSVNLVVSGYLGPLGFGLGYQHRSWVGEDVWVDADGGPSLQLTLAPKIMRWRGWAVSPDLFMRFGAGDEIGTGGMGARVLIGRLGG